MSLTKEDIESFIDGIEGFDDFADHAKFVILAYYYMNSWRQANFTQNDIRSLFDVARVHAPSNFGGIISKLRSSSMRYLLVHPEGGYTLSRNATNWAKKYMRETPSKVAVSEAVVALKGKLANVAENQYLDELIKCHKFGAFRASIVLAWILCIDHLYNYILNKKLCEFNKALAQNKATKVNAVTGKEDFEDIKESVLIEVCRSAKIITKNQRKILNEKLGIRNTYAHPSTMKISEPKAASFIEDLVENVILKLEI